MIEDFYKEFSNEIALDADSQANFFPVAFFEKFSETGSANGDFLSLHETHHEGEGIELSGFEMNLAEGVLFLAVSDFRYEEELQGLDYSQIDKKFKRLKKFFEKSQDKNYLNSLEKTSPGYQVAHDIHTRIHKIHRVNYILFSNARITARKKGIENKKIGEKTFTYNVLDFGRFYEIENSKTEQEPIEVVMRDMGSPPLQYIQAVETSDYKSYLLVMPAKLLAEIYSQYGARLLEHNVRSYLQAQVKTNKGILNTLRKRPEMFFAYNNGLTATASDIKFEPDQSGIASIENFQIVNGGQTTASMLHARDRLNIDIEEASVQLKLSIVVPEKLNEVVSDISKWANTQNKVSASDFWSNHAFHIRVEDCSRRITASREEQFAGSKWFYERARGQYRDEQSKKSSPAEKRKHLAEFPKSQFFNKTDLAKYYMTFECQPHTVSKGAQSNFLIFAEKMVADWDKDDKKINEQWYRDTVAKAIIFKELDKAVLRADWYGGGYKANIVTYTIAWLVNMLKKKRENGLNLETVWNRQTAGKDLLNLLIGIAQTVSDSIQEFAGSENVTQFCKKQGCWEIISVLEIEYDEDQLNSCITSSYQLKHAEKAAKKTQAIDTEIGLEAEFYEKTKEEWGEIINFSNANGIDTHLHEEYIRKIQNGQAVNNIILTRLDDLIKKITKDGFKA